MSPEQRQSIIKEGIIHLMFCIRLYNIQLEEGRYFLHEHPWTAWSWKLPAMEALMSHPQVKCGKGNMCRHGLIIKDSQGDALALKATGWLTNSGYILEELAKQCTNNGGPDDHRHACLQNGRVASAAIYPEKLCYAILRGCANN